MASSEHADGELSRLSKKSTGELSQLSKKVAAEIENGAMATKEELVKEGTSAKDCIVKKMSSSLQKKRANKGHKNLRIRGICTSIMACLTAALVVLGVDRPHTLPRMFAQFTSAASLFIQFKTGRPSMFLLRASTGIAIALIGAHGSACGRTAVGDECASGAWEAESRALRIISVLFVVRAICNSLSLCCQFRFPHHMYGSHGNAQLFCRGWIQLTGVPLGIAKIILQFTIQLGSKNEPEYMYYEIAMSFVLYLLLIPTSGLSLIAQWYLTGPWQHWECC